MSYMGAQWVPCVCYSKHGSNKNVSVSIYNLIQQQEPQTMSVEKEAHGQPLEEHRKKASLRHFVKQLMEQNFQHWPSSRKEMVKLVQ